MTDDLQEDWRTAEQGAADIPDTGGMKHADFQIGTEFLTATGRWRVTDTGTRTVIAIKLDQTDPRNYNGPPYSIVETVFDESDFEACKSVATASP